MRTRFTLTTQQRILILGSDFAQDGPRPRVILAYENLDIGLTGMDFFCGVLKQTAAVSADQMEAHLAQREQDDIRIHEGRAARIDPSRWDLKP